jgi:hypothetical protein
MVYRIVLAAALLAVGATYSAHAQTAEQRQACTNDATTFCGDAIPDRERVYQCLVRRVNLISPACRKVITESRRRPR